MRTARNKLTKDGLAGLKLEIASACDAGVDGVVCGDHRTVLCPDCGSMMCQCMCMHYCPNMPGMPSSEPVEFPLKGEISPLVFELRRTEPFVLCWTCEGHLGEQGKL